VIRVGVDLVSSWLREPAGLSDVSSDPLFSLLLALLDHSFPSTLFAGIGTTAPPFAFFLPPALSPLLLAARLTDRRELASPPDADAGAPTTPAHCSSSVAVVVADRELPHEVPSSLGRRNERGNSGRGRRLPDLLEEEDLHHHA